MVCELYLSKINLLPKEKKKRPQKGTKLSKVALNYRKGFLAYLPRGHEQHALLGDSTVPSPHLGVMGFLPSETWGARCWMWQKRSLQPRLCRRSPRQPRQERGHLCHRRHLWRARKGAGTPPLQLGPCSWKAHPFPRMSGRDWGRDPGIKFTYT